MLNNKFKIFVNTWNIGDINNKHKKTFKYILQNYILKNRNEELLVLGFQEVGLPFTKIINKLLKDNYILLNKESSRALKIVNFQTRMYIYQKKKSKYHFEIESSLSHCFEFSNKKYKSILCTKSFNLMSLKLKNTNKKFNFINTHILPYNKKIMIKSFKLIDKFIKKNSKNYNWLFGDLNSRFFIKNESLNMKNLKLIHNYIKKFNISDKETKKLKSMDLLLKLKKDKKILTKWEESDDIKFKPTYKFDKKGEYIKKEKNGKLKSPGWADRIFIQNKKIKCLKYNSKNVVLSDHLPVFGIYEVTI